MTTRTRTTAPERPNERSETNGTTGDRRRKKKREEITKGRGRQEWVSTKRREREERDKQGRRSSGGVGGGQGSIDRVRHGTVAFFFGKRAPTTARTLTERRDPNRRSGKPHAEQGDAAAKGREVEARKNTEGTPAEKKESWTSTMLKKGEALKSGYPETGSKRLTRLQKSPLRYRLLGEIGLRRARCSDFGKSKISSSPASLQAPAQKRPSRKRRVPS